MGKLSYDQYLEDVTLPATLYRVEIFHTETDGLSSQDIESIKKTLERYRNKYTDASYFFVESTTSEVKGTIVNRTGKRGRPKKRPDGKDVAKHAHLVVIGDEEHSAYSYAQDVSNTLDKRFKCKKTKVVSLGHMEHAVNFIRYCYKQADSKSMRGGFNFSKYFGYPELSS